jgi:hypothetical protein
MGPPGSSQRAVVSRSGRTRAAFMTGPLSSESACPRLGCIMAVGVTVRRPGLTTDSAIPSRPPTVSRSVVSCLIVGGTGSPGILVKGVWETGDDDNGGPETKKDVCVSEYSMELTSGVTMVVGDADANANAESEAEAESDSDAEAILSPGVTGNACGQPCPWTATGEDATTEARTETIATSLARAMANRANCKAGAVHVAPRDILEIGGVWCETCPIT